MHERLKIFGECPDMSNAKRKLEVTNGGTIVRVAPATEQSCFTFYEIYGG